MPYFPSFRLYIEDADDLCDKITRVETAINALIDLLATSALEDDVKEYRLDDGQTTIRVAKRSVAEIERSINGLERVKQIYVNRLNGRVTRLVDHETTRWLNTVV
jgi:hypothetical protein